MTREEAENELTRAIMGEMDNGEWTHHAKECQYRVDALEMGVRSLEAWDKVVSDLKKASKDSRHSIRSKEMEAYHTGMQDAIDIIYQYMEVEK